MLSCYMTIIGLYKSPSQQPWKYKYIFEVVGMTQQQFNDFMNNPAFYAWQDIYSNRSHKFEEKH